MAVTISQYRAAIGLWNRRLIYGKSYNKKMFNHLNDVNAKKLIGSIIIMNLVFIGILNYVVTDQNLSMSIMSMQCLKAFLAISGVEQNPGPMFMAQQSTIEKIKKDGRKGTLYLSTRHKSTQEIQRL